MRTKIIEVLRPIDGQIARFEVPDDGLADASVSQVAEDLLAIRALTGDTRSDAAVARSCVSAMRAIIERRMGGE